MPFRIDFILVGILRHERDHLMYAECDDMWTHLPILLVHPARAMGDYRSVIKNLKRRLQRISRRSGNLAGNDVFHVVPLSTQYAAALSQVERLVEDLGATPPYKYLVRKISRCHLVEQSPLTRRNLLNPP